MLELEQDANNQHQQTPIATTAARENLSHEVINLTTVEGKKFYQETTIGLKKSQKHKGNAKDFIKLIERIKSKAEEV